MSDEIFKYDVFISYSSADKDWVRIELLSTLENEGLKVCIDFRDFEPGAPTVTEIERVIKESRKTLLVLTPAYLNSAWTEYENLILQTIDPANRNRRLIPLLREKCNLPTRISSLTYIDFVTPQADDLRWKRLLDSLISSLPFSEIKLNPESPKIEKSVFISYRRKDIAWALKFYGDLTYHGYDVFFDYTSLASGDFEQNIIGHIKSRAHFLVLLTPDALNRCSEPGDWLRREIETALDEKRNIIPLMLEDFDFRNLKVSEKLTGKLALLKRYNGLTVPAPYFDAAMTRLRKDFLNVPLDAVLHPLSEKAIEVARVEQSAADAALDRISSEISKNRKLKLFLDWVKINVVGGGAILVTSFILVAILISNCGACVMPLAWLFVGLAQWRILKPQTSYSKLWISISIFPMMIIAFVVGMFGNTSGFKVGLFDILTAIVVFGFQMGLTQWIFFRNLFSKIGWWPLSSAVGWFAGAFIPFSMLLVNKQIGNPLGVSDVASALLFVPVAGFVGAITISSLLQFIILRKQLERSYIWLGFNIVFWFIIIFISISLTNILNFDFTNPLVASMTPAEYQEIVKAFGFVSMIFWGGGVSWILLSGLLLTWILPVNEISINEKVIETVEEELDKDAGLDQEVIESEQSVSTDVTTLESTVQQIDDSQDATENILASNYEEEITPSADSDENNDVEQDSSEETQPKLE